MRYLGSTRGYFRRALVTGATGGLGLSLCAALSDAELLNGSIGTYPIGFDKPQVQNLFDTALRAGLVKERHLVGPLLWSGAPIKKTIDLPGAIEFPDGGIDLSGGV